jgi:hypothetical protein
LAIAIEEMQISFRPQLFYIEEVDMFETLSFEGFVSKIHELFDRLPDHRRFSPNLRYSIKDAALGAFALFFSQSPFFGVSAGDGTSAKAEQCPKFIWHRADPFGQSNPQPARSPRVSTILPRVFEHVRATRKSGTAEGVSVF